MPTKIFSFFILLNALFLSPTFAQYSFKQVESGEFVLESISHGLPDSEDWVGKMAVTDLNQDGYQDILSTSPRGRSGPPIVYLGNNKGKWVRWRELQFPQFPYRYGTILSADFDLDGLPDIGLAMDRLALQIFKNQGNGRFSKWLEAGATGDWSNGRLQGFWAKALGISDFDGDSKPDLVALSAGALSQGKDNEAALSDGIRIFTFDQERGWSYRLLNTRVRFGEDLEIANIFGSARGDILSSSLATGERKLLHYFDNELHQWLQVELWPLPTRSTFPELEIVDLNQDQRIEIVVSYQRNYQKKLYSGVMVLFQDEFSSWEPYPLIEERPGFSQYRIISGDFSGNKKPDLLIFDMQGAVRMYERDADILRYWNAEFPVQHADCWVHDAITQQLHEAAGEELLLGFGALEIADFSIRLRCSRGGGLVVYKPRVLKKSSPAPDSSTNKR